MPTIKTLEFFKIPEGIKIPVFNRLWGPFINSLVYNRACNIARNPMSLGCLGNEKPEEIIVSLTSFPERIEHVHICLAQLFNQALPPDRIMLWLAEQQFPSKQLPDNLKPYVKKGLEVRFCPRDLKGHKKYFYVMQEFPEAIVVTFDDDLIYHENSLMELYNSYIKHPDCISCLRSQEIQFDENGNILPYRMWKTLSNNDEPKFSFMPSTGAGTLYPPHLLSEHTFDVDVLSSICLTADDLWMKTMSLLRGTKVARVEKYHRPLTTINGTQDVTLADENIFNNKNDECIANLQNKFPKAFEQLRG